MKEHSGNKKNFSRIALIMTISLLLSGCAGNIPFMNKEQEKQGEISLTAETMGLEPDFSYERNTERPHIQVDRLGYLPKSAKTAVIQWKELPENFQIIEKDSGECVYEGEVRRKENITGDIDTGYCNFTEFEEEGTYYIKCDKIGCSHYFTVGKEVYLETERELGRIIEEMEAAGEKSGQPDEKENPGETADICETVSYLLAAYEMYPGLLLEIWGNGKVESETEEGGGEEFFRMLRSHTDRLLTLQDEKTGGICKTAEGFSETKEDARITEQEISAETTAVFAGTMAKYSYLYQQYDLDYANICLKAAAKAWRYLDGQYGGLTQGQAAGNKGEDRSLENSVRIRRFYAASELYRASNEALYHNYILQNQEFIVEEKEDLYLLLGKTTYLSTRRKVNHELCGQIMDGLMKDAEDIAARTKAGTFLSDGEDADTVLWNMTVMALANYAIMNHEYVTVIANNVHYLLGRNTGAEFLTEDLGSGKAAAILLLLSVVEAEQEIIEASGEQ